ncbi:unnamed protein product [Didymodactylos carnosus]|uniref:Secreted protein n=1 Tax=Didymodactylos carnosus TaxID=1234261 RepID=A0A8S2W917_9BILA|nr:unnamed protein product [Didymodactylos carnosus]CAF4438202.1 unnamed protein product [Didymodactylos carnosus]
MASSVLSFIFLLTIIISHVNCGYWVCDWVNNKGWLYCSRGFCNSYGKKRDLTHQIQHQGPQQQEDGTYCDENYCYICEDLNATTCHLKRVSKNYDHNAKKQYRRDDDCP